MANQSFYNLNEGQAYPLDDAATLLSDAGELLPPAIITDMAIRYPEELGQYVFVSAVAVTTFQVSVVLEVTDDLDGGIFSPLAVLSIRRPVDEGRVFSLLPQTDGVAGWIVFGSGSQELFQGRFSSPRQTLLSLRACRSYRPLPVQSIGKLYADQGLTGLVQLRAEAPLELASEMREIGGVLRNALVLRLMQDPTVTPNVFQLFAGPCSPRPESGTCGDPAPIEFINSVSPNCDGELTLEFHGCSRVANLADESGLVIDCALGLTDACLPPYIPDISGELPGEFPLPDIVPPPPPDEEEPDSPDAPVANPALPYTDCFDDNIAQNFVVMSGQFVLTMGDDSPDEICDPADSQVSNDSEGLDFCFATEGISSAGQRNAAVWANGDTSAIARRVLADVKLLNGPQGAKRNGHIILNHKAHPTIGGRYTYFAAELDGDLQQIRIRYFNGISFQTIASVVFAGVITGRWYRLNATVDAGSDSDVNITVSVTDVEESVLTMTLGPIAVSGYYPSDGDFGLGSYRSHCRFSFFRVEEL